jgi:hypothetical protein
MAILAEFAHHTLAVAPLLRVRRAVVIKDSVNVKRNLSAHTRSWASMPRRQVGHLRGRSRKAQVKYYLIS